MNRSARLWKGVGPLALGGLLLGGSAALGDEPNPLSSQLVGLGRQAQDQGRNGHAVAFYRQALKLDPSNAEARRALDGPLAQVAMQDPVPPPAADVPPPLPVQPPVTIEGAAEAERIVAQRRRAEVSEREARARDLLNQGDAESALNVLRLALSAVQGDAQLPEADRLRLTRELQARLQDAVRKEEQIESARAEDQRLTAATAQSQRDLEAVASNREQVNALMVQFDALMAAGQYNVLYNGGLGDIVAASAPFYTARLYAQQARALAPGDVAPRAGIAVAQFKGFLAQAYSFEELKEYRYMLTLQDVDRASIPFPDTITIEYPPAEFFRAITERRVRRYEQVSLDTRDPVTTAILEKLETKVSMPFAQETPLEDVIKGITQSPALPEGIPIYVDPVGLQEAEKSDSTPVKINLEGMSLKKSLKLLGLTYTVKDGLMTIISAESKDQPTEIRVYPVADLSIIPFSLRRRPGRRQ